MARPQLGATTAPTTIALGDVASAGASGDNTALATHRHGMFTVGAIDHGGLGGLADDDHAMYPRMYDQTAQPADPIADRPTLWFDTDATTPLQDLDDLGDVDAPSPADGQSLVWDAGSGQWVPGAATPPAVRVFLYANFT